MTTYLTSQQLSLTLSTRVLLNNASFSVRQGEKIGLIGQNGCGKSTLLHALTHPTHHSSGTIHRAKHCVIARVEQHFPASALTMTAIDLLRDHLAPEDFWRADALCQQLGLSEYAQSVAIQTLSGGQQMRLLMGIAIIQQPDLLLLDEPSNHLDLPSLLWLETFLSQWKGAFIIVSHDSTLLDNVTSISWILRDAKLHTFALPCTQARQALVEQDSADQQRFNSEQKEIDRLEASAKRLANWGKVYDNEDLARKAKTMQARKEKLQVQQTVLSRETDWRLQLRGQPLPANRLLDIKTVCLSLPQEPTPLLTLKNKQVKSGENIAILGRNGCGKSTLLKALYASYQAADTQTVTLNIESMLKENTVTWHPKCQLGYYDQDLEQLDDTQTIHDALIPFAPLNDDQRKQALISTGFAFERHQQYVHSLSGGERARLLFLGLSLAQHHMLFLDEPTNHLDLEGKEQLIETLQNYAGAAVLVSHDRDLLRQTCQRFWIIINGKVHEWTQLDDAVFELLKSANQESMNDGPSSPLDDTSLSLTERQDHDQSHDLERLIELEEKLASDRQRKPKHQKPQHQRAWQEEINRLTRKLSL
ncbi:ABC-F family ATP-binding cassette domain-containing protein [Vibrio zhugei]|uniref:ABC-F family ATP-binding cassette domain-containing protein n=1 Tax=Vibrio zhugei TaxID=2479546 RepID=A0ABV7C9C8_9VIBR|nr:ABC-F family ATP-binding cassette domain-containing protein [Vibrio zhugei]